MHDFGRVKLEKEMNQEIALKKLQIIITVADLTL